jgi:anti-anti-sigma factor
MPVHLDISETGSGDAVVLALRGGLDRENGEALVCRLSRRVYSGVSVVVDLAALGSIDPAGVDTLRRAAAWAAQDGWSLSITGATEDVRRVLRSAGADLPLAG